MKKNLLIALALQFTGSAMAAPAHSSPEDQWYQADIVVFRYLHDNSGEAWPPITTHNTGNSISLTQMPETSTSDELFNLEPHQEKPQHVDPARDPYTSLSASESHLEQQVASLKQGERYQVLTQKSWRMPVGSEHSKQPIKLRAASSETSSYLLEGTVSISEERFLHVDVDLWLSKLSPEELYSNISDDAHSGSPIDNKPREIPEKGHTGYTSEALLQAHRKPDHLIRLTAGGPTLRVTDNFQLKQRRRIRHTREVQYLDSPVIGVLFKLTPYDRPTTLMETRPEPVTDS
ncbi:MAG: CsiV family protein [Endozoicomonas sp.]